MNRVAKSPTNNHRATRRAVHSAVQEMKAAVRPRKSGTKGSGGLSTLLTLAAGAFVVWNGLRSTQTEEVRQDEANTAVVSIQSPHLEAQSEAEKSVTDVAAPQTGETVQGFAALAKEFYARFNQDECMTRAYALAFILVLSLVPLLLFALAVIGFLIHSPQQAEDLTRQMISGLLPGQQAGQAANEFIQQTHIAEAAQTLMNGKIWALAGGVLSLVWAAIGLFVSASDPMNKAWDVTETRSFVALRVRALGVFVAAFAFFALSLFVTSGAHGALASLGVPDNLPPFAAFLVDLLFFALAALINGGMFCLIYRFLPNTKVTWKSAAFGGLIVGILLEIFKQGFAVYLAHFGNFNKVYGTFGGLFLLVTWISYSCILLLAGAIVCKMFHEHAETGGVVKR